MFTGKVKTRIGTKNYNLFGSASAQVASTNANLSAGLFNGQNKKYGFLLDGNAGVQALKGDANFGGTLFGISMQGTIGGTAGSVHAGATGGAYYDGKNGTFNIKFQQNLGLGFGEKAGFEVKIPMPFKK